MCELFRHGKAREVDMITRETKSSNELATERTDLAEKRNLMAADRTLMAWIRTALSMISFGFTIYKVLEGFQESGVAAPNAASPRNIGLFLTGLGTVSMVMGTVEYWQTLKDLRHLRSFRIWRPSFVLALIMSITGLFLFVSIISRVF
jgi:putative membrane protein